MARTAVTNRWGIRDFPYSITYDGGSNYGASNSTVNTISGSAAFTMGCWIKINVLNGTFQRFLAIGNGTNFNALQISTANFWGNGDSGDGVNYASTVSPKIGNWYFVAIVCAGGAGGMSTLYVNNVAVLTQAQTNNISGTSFAEGSNIDGNYKTFCQISQSFLYSRALSTAELTAAYLNGRFPSNGLLGLWQHTEGSGTSIADTSGNGKALTTSGTPAWATNSPSKKRSIIPTQQNLLQYSEQLGTAPWSAQGSMTITANQATAPDGTLTAEQAVATGSASLLQAVTVVPGATYTFSFWAKNNGGSIASYRAYDNTNSAEIVAQTSYFSQINGSTWTRVSFTFTAPARCISALVYPMSVPATGGNVFLWGAQLVQANWPGPYIQTTASAVNTGNIRNIMPQAQNLFAYSEQFDNAVWGKTSTTISANTSTNPVDGAMTADTFIVSSSSTTNYGVYYNTPGVTFMARPYTFSVFLKYTNYQYVLVEMDNSGTSGAIFDLVGGTATGVATGVVASMASMGNGWYRCAVTKTMTASTQYPDILLNNSPTSFTRTATATSGVTSLLLFGAQLVQANWPGAYTPTTATAVNTGNVRNIA